MKNSITTFLSLTGAILAIGSPTASAIIIQDSNAGGNSGTDNVLFNAIVNDATNPLQASVNGQAGFIVNFNSTSDTLIGNGGQATLGTADGSFSNLSISLANGTFTKLILNPTAGPTGGTINFSVNYNVGNLIFLDSFSLSANGNNFFQVLAGGGETINSVTFNTVGTGIVGSGQFRIGGLAGPTTSVPDGGATVALLGLALGGLSVGRRFLNKA
ncbi:MAG: VPDSG-CTERM sorting domain-containing protein [Verrucomicrobiota bacterium]